jgi:hypothetical protein
MGCHRDTPGRQVSALRNAAVWIAAWMRSSVAQAHPPPSGEMSLVRAEPDCDGCRLEPPFQRDTDLPPKVLSSLRQVAASFTLSSLEVEATLTQHAFGWLFPEVHLDAGSGLRLGSPARQALIVANNLVQAAKPGPALIGVAADDVQAACLPSLLALSRAFGDDSAAGGGISAADLVTIHWLHSGVRDIYGYSPPNSRGRGAVRPPPQMNLRAPLLGLLGLFTTLLLIGGVAAQNGYALLLGLFALAGAVYVWFRVRPPAAAPAPSTGPTPWTTLLEHARSGPQAEAYRAALEGLRRADLLDQAACLFDGTAATDIKTAAATLRGIHATPCGDAVIKWIARQAAQAATAETLPRFCALGEELLRQDIAEEAMGYASTCRGTDIVGLLVTELLCAIPDRGEDSRLWELAAGQATLQTTGFYDVEFFPHLLAEMMRRAATLEQRTPWPVLAARYILRCRDLATTLLMWRPLISPFWHLLPIRLLAAGLPPGGRPAIRFPSRAGCSLSSLCTQIENSHRAFKVKDDPGDDGTTPTDGPLASVAAEALAVMTRPDFLPSLELLLSRYEQKAANPPPRPAAPPSALDELIAQQLPNAQRARHTQNLIDRLLGGAPPPAPGPARPQPPPPPPPGGAPTATAGSGAAARPAAPPAAPKPRKRHALRKH